MFSKLTDALAFQSQALVLRSERQRLIASNIANADTPGYVARDFDFRQALEQATAKIASGMGLSPKKAARLSKFLESETPIPSKNPWARNQ